MVHFQILGPFEARQDEGRLPLGGRRQRALLACLLLHRGEVVSTDRLLEEIWAGAPPPAGAKTVQAYVSRLRRVLGAGVIETRGGGYALDADGVTLDLDLFEEIVAAARRLAADGSHGAAAVRFDEALALWVGEPLADLAYEPFAQVEIARLAELRLLALEERLDALLAAGGASELVPELEALVREHPGRERLYGQLMLALYRSGRQAEALEAYGRARARLDDELGLEPGPQLRELERQILTHDPELGPPSRRRRATSRRAVPALVAGAAVLLAAAAGAGFALTRGEATAGLASVAPNSLAEIDPSSGAVVAEIPVGARPAGVSVAGSTVWVENEEDRTVTRVNGSTHRVVRTLPVGEATGSVLAAGGRVWVSTRAGALRRVDPEFQTLVEVANLREPLALGGTDPRELAAAYGSVWVTSSLGLVSRVDPRSGRVHAPVEAGEGASGIAAGAGSLWVANTSDGTVSRIDRTGAVLATIPVGHGPTGVAFSAGAAWVTNTLDGTLVRIDATTNAPVAPIPVGASPTGVAATDGAVWVAVSGEEAVVEVDPKTNQVERRIELGARPVGVAAGGGSVWVTVQPAHEPVGRPGGTARLTVEADPGTLDPAVTYDPIGYALLYATCAKLVTYPDAPAPAGAVLVPEVAESMPQISDGGRTYTFTVRDGFRFSPPSSRPVTAATFKRSIERVLAPATRSPVAGFLDDVVGARAFRTGRAAHVSGITARGHTLTIHLVQPRGDLTARLAMPNFCAVPPNTPLDPSGVPRIPSPGPYYIAAATPGAGLVLRRNLNYGGGRPHRLERIDVRAGVSKAAGLQAVLEGRSDWPLDGVPTSERARIASRYRGAGHDVRAFVNPSLTVHFLALNHTRPPFDDPRVRRAVSYAIDRPALVEAHRRFNDWGSLGGGKVNDQYLPPGMPGHAAEPLYPPHPDVRAARRLAGAGRRQATLIVCNTPPCPQIGAIVKRNLAAIGIDVSVRRLPLSQTYQHAAMMHPDWDLLVFGFSADYVDPGTFLNLFAGSGTSIGAEPPLGLAPQPAVARALARAAQVAGPERRRAYADLARNLAREAVPAVAFATSESLDLFSTRVGCQTYNPVYGMDLAALCVVEGARDRQAAAAGARRP